MLLEQMSFLVSWMALKSVGHQCHKRRCLNTQLGALWWVPLSLHLQSEIKANNLYWFHCLGIKAEMDIAWLPCRPLCKELWAFLGLQSICTTKPKPNNSQQFYHLLPSWKKVLTRDPERTDSQKFAPPHCYTSRVETPLSAPGGRPGQWCGWVALLKLNLLECTGGCFMSSKAAKRWAHNVANCWKELHTA